MNVLMLNLVEVTVPWGKVNADFNQRKFQILEQKMPIR
jgi:hypothetical protein